MEYESDQFIAFPIGLDPQEPSVIKTDPDCLVPEMLTDPVTDVEITCPQSEPSPTVIKTDPNSADDESMAVEALRQLGNVVPRFEKKPCPSCNVLFSSCDLDRHLASCKVAKYSCSICPERFEKKAEYSNHMVCHQVDRPHACRTCGTLFKTKSSLQVHMTEAHQAGKVYRCNICGVDFQRPSSLSNHMKIHNYVAGRAISQKNSDQASTSTSLQEVEWSTVYMNESPDSAELQEFTVVNGQLEYPSQQFVIETFENSSESSIKIKSVESLEGEKASPIECEFCDKQFRDQNHLATHQKTCIKRIAQTSGSDQASKHACTECGKKFTTKQKMFRHQWIHRKKTHSCEVCGSQFERQVQLDEHRLAAHPGDSPFTCTECGKSFVSRQGLWEHGRTHAGSPAHFHCDKCSKTFTSRQGYLIHHRTHTGERPYGCKFCWKAFRDGGTLRKHERIHTGERPHVCPICGRAFNQKVVLREHVRWVHAASKQISDSEGPPFACPLCGDLSHDRDELCAHIVKHSDKMIADAKAKTTEPKKSPTKPTKRKGKKKREEEEEEEQLYLTVEPKDQVFVDVEKQQTYILVNAGKNGKFQVMDGDKRVSKETIEICVEEEEGKKNTLQLISKRNAGTPVLAIPNPQSDQFSSQIQLMEQEEFEQDELEVMQVQFDQDEIDECRVCGEIGFNDKSELMEHVKTHM